MSGLGYTSAMPETTNSNRLQQKLVKYKPSAETIQLIRQTPIVLLVGISGAGKDSIKQRLLKTGDYHHIVSHTTRRPRENKGIVERDGVDYHFIDLSEAERMLDSGAYVEAKLYSGNVYGTSVAEIQKAHDDGKIALTDIEVQGVAEYKAISKSVHAVFVLPPSYQVWQQRLRNRSGGNIDPEDLARRLQTAKIELQEALNKNYFEFVINDELESAVTTVDGIAHEISHTKKSQATRELAQQLLTEL